MKYAVTIEHVDTCLPCYVLDHCNGDNEQLFGVPIFGTSTYREVLDHLNKEIEWVGDKLPEDMDPADWRCQLDAMLENIEGWADEAVEPSLPNPDDDEFDYTLECYCWFRVSWEPVA